MQAQLREFLSKIAGPVACTERRFPVLVLRANLLKNQIEVFVEPDKVERVTAS